MKKILLLSALAIFLNSCSDSRSEGCTDPYAVNYESFADYDDGSLFTLQMLSSFMMLLLQMN